VSAASSVEHRRRASVLVWSVERTGEVMTSSQGYSVGSIDYRASSVRVEGRGSSIPTSSVGRSSRATGSGSGQCPTVDYRADGRGDEFAGLRCRQHRVSSVEHSNVEPGAFESSIGVEPASDCRLSRGRARLWNSDEFTGLQFRDLVITVWLGGGMRVRS
jgi:hypothetical protein